MFNNERNLTVKPYDSAHNHIKTISEHNTRPSNIENRPPAPAPAAAAPSAAGASDCAFDPDLITLITSNCSEPACFVCS